MTISTFLLDLVCAHTNLIRLCIELSKIDFGHFSSQQSQHFDYFLASILSTTSIGVSCLFFYCYFGELATASYENMSDCAFDMRWYEQPYQLQKCAILMIQNMQKPLHYHGFEMAYLNLSTFIAVITLSYFIQYQFRMESLMVNCSAYLIFFQFQLCKKVFSFYLAIKALATK